MFHKHIVILNNVMKKKRRETGDRRLKREREMRRGGDKTEEGRGEGARKAKKGSVKKPEGIYLNSPSLRYRTLSA